VSDDRLILVGRIAGAFGVRGEIKITAFTADPSSLLAWRDLLRADGSPALTLIGGRAAGGQVIAQTAEPLTRESAQSLKGLALYIPRSRLPAPDEDDEFYLADLIGLTAVSPEGTPLGHVKSVHNFGAGDLLEIAPVGGAPSWWTPFTREAVPDIRLESGEAVVVPPDVES
jgi:16S rRNA processing protein RimM